MAKELDSNKDPQQVDIVVVVGAISPQRVSSQLEFIGFPIMNVITFTCARGQVNADGE
jgi:hypothetical protein